jgi:ankyrin repeat protein
MELQLWTASEDVNSSEVKDILKNHPGVNVNWANEDGFTALHMAAQHGHHEIATALLAHPDTNVNQRTIINRTPLNLACYWGNVEVLKVLLKDSRVDVNLADVNNRTPLWCASYYGDVKVITWMITMRGDELDLDKKGMYYSNEYTSTEIAT